MLRHFLSSPSADTFLFVYVYTEFERNSGTKCTSHSPDESLKPRRNPAWWDCCGATLDVDLSQHRSGGLLKSREGRGTAVDIHAWPNHNTSTFFPLFSEGRKGEGSTVVEWGRGDHVSAPFSWFCLSLAAYCVWLEIRGGVVPAVSAGGSAEGMFHQANEKLS